ncbi:MAG: SWIM zinc finger family protein [Planctomycetes bacterium]|nr:SWIM zinc finger family protein [Planctomycetota bacterium]
MWWREFYPKSKPRKAKGGIKASSKRGAIGQTWWAKRWVDVLESFDIGGRLARGKSYARRGQVLKLDVSKGEVTAEVQGSQPDPYDVTIRIKTLTDAEWKELAGVLSKQAIFLAKLLAGEMPQDVEQAFTEAGLSLFPRKSRDLETDCSCPDDSNPCKHIAAVYYLLGEEFDRDPFLLFRLRGLGREELLGMLGEAGRPAETPTPEEPAVAPEPLVTDPRAFWGDAGVKGDDLVGEVAAPPVSAALPQRLGGFPFWRGQERLLDVLKPAYQAASSQGLDVVLGETTHD